MITPFLKQLPGVFVETEGSAPKMQKNNKKVKKGTPNLTSPYFHSIFTIFLIKQIFEKKNVIKGSIWKSGSILK